MTRPHGDSGTGGSGTDEGTALVEFTYLAILLMVPLVYVMTSAFQVQKAAFGVTEAARQAGRAYATADSPASGEVRARIASSLALADQGIRGADPPSVSCPDGACLAPGSTVEVTVAYTVRLPVLSAFFGRGSGPGIPVRASHTGVVDTFQQGAPPGSAP